MLVKGKIFQLLGVVLLLIIISYSLWSNLGRGVETTAKPFLSEIAEYGTDQGQGNLITIQPYMMTFDYANQDSFQNKLDLYLQTCQKKGWLTPKTVVVFPEYIGSWLVIANEKKAVYQAKTMKSAMKTLVLSNLFSFLKEVVKSPAQDKVKYSLFKMKAPVMAQIYQNTFSVLAKKYQVHIVAGSILLPEPKLETGNLILGEGPLYNISLVYQPNGQPYNQLVKKVYPTEEEQPFVAQGPKTELPVFQTSLGTLGVVICADAWYPSTYEVLQKKQVEIITVTSFGSSYLEKWKGYSGYPAPQDVELNDIQKITKREAWLKYTLPNRIKSTKASYGVNSFLHGKLWDISNNGYSFVVANGKLHEAKPDSKAALINLWLK